MSRIKHMMVTIARLHNVCIGERLAESRGTVIQFTPASVAFDPHIFSLHDKTADEEFCEIE
jgi:hypothetical protein